MASLAVYEDLMNAGTIFVPLFFLVSLVASCSAELDRTHGETVVKLEITGIEPAPPLDPYRPFTVSYSITNNSTLPLSIPDLDKLELEVRHESGAPMHRRTLPLPLSVAAIQDVASAKVPPPEPFAVTVEPQAVRRGTFPALDAWPSLPDGQVSAVLRLPLAQGASLESQPLQFQVTRVSSAFEQELIHGKAALTDVPVSQKLITVPQTGGTRLLLLSTIYPGFLSVVADCALPQQQTTAQLLLYWPQDPVRLMVAEVSRQSVLIFTVDRQGHSPADRLILHDSLPLPGNSDLLGLVRVGHDEDKVGIEDYLVVAMKTEQDSRFVITEYWRRNTADSTWSHAEVSRCATQGGAGKLEFRPQGDGFEVHLESDTSACVIPLAEKLAEYRRLASEDKNPLRIITDRK